MTWFALSETDATAPPVRVDGSDADHRNDAGDGIFRAINHFSPDGSYPWEPFLDAILSWTLERVPVANLALLERGIQPSEVVSTANGLIVRWRAERATERRYVEIADKLAGRYGGRPVAIDGLVREFGFVDRSGREPHFCRLLHLSSARYTDEHMLMHTERSYRR